MESIIQELTDKLAAANKEIEKLNKRLEWVNEPPRGHETVEYLSKCYRQMLLDQSEDETKIEELLKFYLSEYELYGDSYGVPSTVDRIECFVKKFEELKFRTDSLEK